MTAPLRAAARAAGDADGFHPWARQGHGRGQAIPAATLVRVLTLEADAALAAADLR